MSNDNPVQKQQTNIFGEIFQMISGIPKYVDITATATATATATTTTGMPLDEIVMKKVVEKNDIPLYRAGIRPSGNKIDGKGLGLF